LFPCETLNTPRRPPPPSNSVRRPFWAWQCSPVSTMFYDWEVQFLHLLGGSRTKIIQIYAKY
jgi:hypothetical protein